MNVWKMSRILNRFPRRAHYLCLRSACVLFFGGAKMKTRSSDIFLLSFPGECMVKGLRIREEPPDNAARAEFYPRNEIVLF